MRIVWSLLVVLCLGAVQLGAQVNDIIGYYSLDCSINDQSGNNLHPTASGNPACVCGIRNNALRFDPATDALAFPASMSNYIGNGSFTLAFYFRATHSAGTQVLFSKRADCSGNRAFSVRYNGQTNQLLVLLSEDATQNVSITQSLPADKCWYHIAVSRTGTKIRLYVDGKLAFITDSNKSLNLSSTDSLHVGWSPCLGISEVPFAGDLDEMYLYRSAIPDAQIAELYDASDRILSNDKFVYLGKGTDVQVSPSCAASYSWTPTAGVADPDTGTTFITPAQSTTYQLQFAYPGCIASDTIRLTVVDPATIDCDQLMLPSAFTPNGDGLNDTYRISNADIIKELVSFEIFDRLGNQVFEGKTPEAAWDGSFKGQAVNPGTFLYKVRFKCGDTELVKSGPVQVIR